MAAKLSTVAETLAHPAFPTAQWNLEPHSRGSCTVAQYRGGPFKIAWKLHGEGPIKLILVPGLACTTYAWQRQVRYFGHDHGDRFTVLSYDNRGMGDSDKPFGRYTTSNMALDILEVADDLGWVGEREIHVVGISLGGMIAQEVAAHSPTRLASLTLLATGPAFENTKSWSETITTRISLLMPRSLERNISDTATQLFTPEFLAAPDQEELPSPGTTPRCGPATGSPDGEYKLFDTNFQRFQAMELTKKRNPKAWSATGLTCQLMAAAGHRKNEQELRAVAEKLGRERIAVIHGTRDEMFDVSLGKKLIAWLEPAEAHILEGMGHAPVYEGSKWFNGWLAEWLEKCHAMGGTA